MSPGGKTRSARVSVSFAFLLTTFTFFPLLPFALSASRRTPPSPTQVPDLVTPYSDLAYDKPIIFFERDAQILVFYPNGDIIYRGRKLTNDRAVVQALQEILSLSPCRREGKNRAR